MEQNDHRVIGKDLKFFKFFEEAPGMPFYLPKGKYILSQMENYLREFLEIKDYQEVQTPFIMSKSLWDQSGHYQHYKDNMYFTEDGEREMAVKPMNCPGHMLVYKSDTRSYKDLPIKYMEFGQVHRNELHGNLNGLMRARTFKQDDAHIYCLPNQIEEEIGELLKLIDVVYNHFGLKYEVELSTRPESYMGEEASWDKAEAALKSALDKSGKPYRVNEGDGAFYGPKIDFHVHVNSGKTYQTATIQLDFQMAEKFDLSYVDEHSNNQRPVIIHRAIYGSLDRFFGILIEHFNGRFPARYNPEEIRFLPVSEKHVEFCNDLRRSLVAEGVKATVDDRSEKLGYKIKSARQDKVYSFAVIGDKEVESSSFDVQDCFRNEKFKSSRSDIIRMFQMS